MADARLDNAVLVVAHPDDEALWFSSILKRVTRIIVAYEACADRPHLGEARRAASGEHPLANMTFLRHPEPCSLDWADWRNPIKTAYGMELNRPGAGEVLARYRRSFEVLRRDLHEALASTAAVFTHNPRGEYGHPDHVQLSAVVRSVAAELGFQTLFSTYVAPRTLGFAAEFLPHLRRELTLDTDRELAAKIKAVYTKHGAWTWYDRYELPLNEAFLTVAEEPRKDADTLPLGCLMLA